MSEHVEENDPGTELAESWVPEEPVDEALHVELGDRAYRALTGLNYGDKRVEAGELVDDLPEESVEWLLNDGHIEKVED